MKQVELESNFRHNLKLLMRTKNLTAEELAGAIGMHRQTVSKWRNDGVNPNVSTLAKVCKVFKVTVDQMLTEKMEASYNG